MIGAAGMSDMARALEEAAASCDEEFIRTHHEAAMTEYKRLAEGIAMVCGESADAADPGTDAQDGDDGFLEFLPSEDTP